MLASSQPQVSVQQQSGRHRNIDTIQFYSVQKDRGKQNQLAGLRTMDAVCLSSFSRIDADPESRGGLIFVGPARPSQKLPTKIALTARWSTNI